MLPTPRSACLVLADISGYATYLASAELDHAQDILADLTDTVVSALRPTFRLAKLEGDAAFVFAEVDRVDGSVLQDTIEGTYFAFRRRLRDIRQATTCSRTGSRRRSGSRRTRTAGRDAGRFGGGAFVMMETVPGWVPRNGGVRPCST